MSEQSNNSLYGDSDTGAREQPRPIGLMELVSGVFQEPPKLFARLSGKPQWIGPTLLLTGMSLVLSTVWLIGVDAQEFMALQLEKAGLQLSSEQIEMGAKFLPINVIFGSLVVTPLGICLMGLVYWALGKASREDPQWRPTYHHGLVVAAVPALAALPNILLGTLMTLIQPVGTHAPNQLAPSALGYWIESESPKLSALYYLMDPFLMFHYAAVFFAAKYAMRAKTWGAALCVAVALLTPALTVMSAK